MSNYTHEFVRIMGEELKLRGDQIWEARHLNFFRDSHPYTSMDFRMRLEQLVEFARNSLEPRSYVTAYGVSQHPLNIIKERDATRRIVHESVGAHSNLVGVLVDRALTYCYGPDFGDPESEWPKTIDGYSLRVINEVVRTHDLPENLIGDWPDNGSTDPVLKESMEKKYYASFDLNYLRNEKHFVSQVQQLRDEMEHQSSSTGRLLYSADKTAAIMATLTYDKVGLPPRMPSDNPKASPRDRSEMALCDRSEGGYHRASEMWTIDHLHIRQLTKYDDSGFFTALIVMYTLIVNGHWYEWREEDYRAHTII